MSAQSAHVYDRPFDYHPVAADQVQVIHNDAHVLVINKPSGLLSVPGKGEHLSDCVASYMAERFDGARIVHRLDMATSGMMILAMTAKAQRHLGLQFERRHTAKTYLARVWGGVEGDAGTIDKPMRCDWPNRPRQIIDFEQGKSATTHWRVMSRNENSTLMELTPITGRSHQLRVHMLELGHPILGDRLYAPESAFIAADRLLLHAHSLELHHPEGGARVKFTADCPF